MNELPRRCKLPQLTLEELLIYQTIQSVERLGADPVLTEVVVLLNQAKEKLADWVDKKETNKTIGLR